MFFLGGGDFGPPRLTLKPFKKNKRNQKTNPPKNTTHNTIKTKEIQYNKKRKPEHSNLICPITRIRKQNKKTQKFKTNKRKGQHNKIRVLKANAKKPSKTCRK